MEFQTAFDPVLHLQHFDVSKAISDSPLVHHSDSVVAVQDHTRSCDCDVAFDPRYKFPLEHTILDNKEMYLYRIAF